MWLKSNIILFLDVRRRKVADINCLGFWSKWKIEGNSVYWAVYTMSWQTVPAVLLKVQLPIAALKPTNLKAFFFHLTGKASLRKLIHICWGLRQSVTAWLAVWLVLWCRYCQWNFAEAFQSSCTESTHRCSDPALIKLDPWRKDLRKFLLA